jgi:hypothetical protein
MALKDFDSSQQEEFLRNYSELKSLLENTLKKIKHLDSPREAKGLLITVQNAFKGRKLKRDQREELYSHLQEAFEEIHAKITEEQSQFEKTAHFNFSEFRIRLQEAQFLVDHSRDFHETWEHLLRLQNEFREAKFLREHREELYRQLQHAFDTLKQKNLSEKSKELADSSRNFQDLYEQSCFFASQANSVTDFRIFKDELICFQSHVRECHLVKEHRNQIQDKIQEAFVVVQTRQEEDLLQNKNTSEKKFDSFKPRVDELYERSETSPDFHEVRESIRQLQNEIRNAGMLKEHRDELNQILQEAFLRLGRRQDTEQNSFHQEAGENYQYLKKLVDQGFSQAENSTKYKETREFLKKIQSEFKRLKLIREQREELYTVLQKAFTILNKRVDEFFRNKKKNWMLKMEYRFTESSGNIFRLEEGLEKDLVRIKELEDQLEIALMADKEDFVIEGLRSRIQSLQRSIEKKQAEIKDLEQKMEDLHQILEPDESATDDPE